MKSVGIITEYNPFHNGHQAMIRETRRLSQADCVIAVMSGSFVQRGDVAIFDKWSRAEVALRNGVDLVVELPTAFSVRSAEWFARGGIGILSALSADAVSFGTESPLPDLIQTATALSSESADFQTALHQALDAGKSYPSALEDACLKCGILPPRTPNDILAIEYLKALPKHITPIGILRIGAGHDEIGADGISSASHIRSLLKQGDTETARSFVPSLPNTPLHSLSELEPAIFALLRTRSEAELRLLPDVEEGLEHRLKQAALRTASLPELVKAVKTKRYTAARIRRILIYLLLGMSEASDCPSPEYIRILGMNAVGQAFLKEMKDHCSIPIITKVANATPSAMLDLDLRATDLHALATKPEYRMPGNLDYRTSPIIIK